MKTDKIVPDHGSIFKYGYCERTSDGRYWFVKFSSNFYGKRQGWAMDRDTLETLLQDECFLGVRVPTPSGARYESSASAWRSFAEGIHHLGQSPQLVLPKDYWSEVAR